MYVAFMNASFAQEQVYIGIKAGPSIPNLAPGGASDPLSQGYSSRLDIDAAVHAEFYLVKFFFLQLELEYSSQGGKKNGTQAFAVPGEMLSQFPPGQAPPYLYATYKSEARINYLVLPVLVKYYFHLKKRWNPYVAAGPFISYLLNAKNITSGSSIIYLDAQKKQPLTSLPQSFGNTVNVRDDLHHFNAGISGHFGLSYGLITGSLFLEAGGNYGLIAIQKNDENGKNKTGAAIINIGYQFKL